LDLHWGKSSERPPVTTQTKKKKKKKKKKKTTKTPTKKKKKKKNPTKPKKKKLKVPRMCMAQRRIESDLNKATDREKKAPLKGKKRSVSSGLEQITDLGNWEGQVSKGGGVWEVGVVLGGTDLENRREEPGERCHRASEGGPEGEILGLLNLFRGRGVRTVHLVR